jgi:biotin carboxylase
MKKKAIVLGGTDDHIRLIEILRVRGYYVILVDYYENPPARSFADEHIRESTLDKDLVLEIAKLHKVHLVVTACIDQALLTACYVAEKLKLPTPFNYNTALRVTNKAYMKQRMVDTGIPTSRFVVTESPKDVEVNDLTWPLMVKPVDSNGSFGVRKVNNIKELEAYLEVALNISRSGRAIIEEYKAGKEISVDVFIENKKATIVMMSQLRKKSINKNVNLIFQTLIPPEISDKTKAKIEVVANKIAENFTINNSPLLMQVIVDDNDEINIIEFAPRIGGGSKYRTIQTITGVDMVSHVLDSFLGIKSHVVVKSGNFFYSRSHIYALPGRLGQVKHINRLIDDGTIEEFIHYKTEGMEIGENYASRDRIGSFFVRAENTEILKNKINKAISTLEVIDLNGKPIMRKDIFEGSII